MQCAILLPMNALGLTPDYLSLHVAIAITVDCYLVSGKGKVKLKGRYNEPISSWLTIRKNITEG